MMQGDTLTVFRNDDTGLERPFTVSVPPSVDTLAELCQYLTAKIPLHGSEAAAPRGLRFLYSLRGKPLWRVKECVDAGTIVVSIGPGFQVRRPQALADAAFDEVAARALRTPPSKAVPDAPPAAARTPPGASVLSASSIAGSPSGASAASASPPVRQPMPQSSHNRTAVYEATDASPPPKPTPAKTTPTSTTSRTSRVPRADDIYAGGPIEESLSAFSLGEYPATASSERAAQYRVSITRPRGTSAGAEPAGRATVHGGGGGSHVHEFRHSDGEQAPFVPPEQTEDAEAGEEVEVEEAPASLPHHPKRLFTHSEESAGESAAVPETAAESGTRATRIPARGQFYVKSHAYELPPSPSFLSRQTSDQLSEYVEDDEAFLQRLRLLLARKVVAAGELRRRDDREVLCRSHFASLHERVMDQLTPQGGRSVCRLIVEGPACSGVSSTTALLAEACIADFARHHQFFNHLLFPLDLSAVLASAPAASCVEIPMLYSVVMGALMDAVAVQRPALRPHSVLLFELWEKLMTGRQSVEAPDFLSYHQIPAIVGFKVVSRWQALAQAVFPLLKAACADPTSSRLRDAALDAIFYAIPAEVAASLRFGGLVYVLDGLEHLCPGQSAVATHDRPAHADLSAVLKPLWDDAHCNVLLSWPSRVPGERIFLPHTTRRVQTIGLLALSPKEATAAGLPLRLVTAPGERGYPLSVLLGAPGYMAQLLPLLRPRLLKTQLPTTAFSAAYQTMKKAQEQTPFVLHLDDADAAAALAEFRQVTRAV